MSAPASDTVSTWAVADVLFSPEQVAAVEGVIEHRLGGVSRIRLAFLGGSLAVGLGHGTSDVDVYVVGDGLPTGEIVHTYDGIQVHVNPMTADKVRRLLDLGTRFRATGADREQVGIEWMTLNALIRLATGIPLRIGEEWRQALSAFDFDVVRRILIVRNGNICAAMAEDAFGALEIGDLLTATTAAAMALEAAGEATLAAAGDVYFGPKFHYRRLARTAATAPWLDHLWQLDHRDLHPARGATAREVRAVVEERLWAAGQLMASCVLDGWDKPLSELPAPTRPGGDSVRRDVFFIPLRFADGWALIGPAEGYEVSEAVVRLWRALDGRPSTELTAQDVPAEIGDIEAAVASLAAVGAVEALPVGTAEPDPRYVMVAPHFGCHPKAAGS
ncbi:hypothetical protein [Nocardia sp. NPDC051570]|uniref:hypothetical protein n=1 Tax=Nocardia sp. NPDC051570 TaxID=3364324 RepID=UPI003796AEEE